jgi:hypothetical protein
MKLYLPKSVEGQPANCPNPHGDRLTRIQNDILFVRPHVSSEPPMGKCSGFVNEFSRSTHSSCTRCNLLSKPTKLFKMARVIPEAFYYTPPLTPHNSFPTSEKLLFNLHRIRTYPGIETQQFADNFVLDITRKAMEKIHAN